MTKAEASRLAINRFLEDWRLATMLLKSATKQIYPVGSWVKVRGIVGKVHAHTEPPDALSLLLEHGDTRVFDIDQCEPATCPAWAKRGTKRALAKAK